MSNQSLRAMQSEACLKDGKFAPFQGQARGQSYNIILTWAAGKGLREMARKPRLEFAGATYHVLSRGNYRKELFNAGSAKLFEKTLFEASRKCEWFLHAYVIMSNHYHLAVETAEGNLVEGMRSFRVPRDPLQCLTRRARTCFSISLQESGDRGGETAFGTRRLHSSQSCARRSSDCREVAHLPSVQLSEVL